MAAIKTGYRRKPKAKRVPPIMEWDHFEMTKEEAKIKLLTSDYLQSVGYGHRVTIHVRPDNRAITLLIQQYVARYSKKPIEESSWWKNLPETARNTPVPIFRQPRFVPYTKAETIHVRTFFLTKKDNVATLFYDVNYDGIGSPNKIMLSPFMNERILIPRINRVMAERTVMERSVLGKAEHAYVFNEVNWYGFLATAHRILGKSVFLEDMYPMSKILSKDANRLWGAGAMRAETALGFTVAIFGKRNTRRDLVRAVGSLLSKNSVSAVEKTNRIAWAWLFKDLVPVDWIVTALNLPANYLGSDRMFEEAVQGAGIYRGLNLVLTALKPLRPAELKNMLMTLRLDNTLIDQLTDVGRSMIQRGTGDRMVIVPDHKNFKSVRQYHDVYFAEERRMNRIIHEQRLRDEEAYRRERGIAWGLPAPSQPKEMYVNYHPEADKLAQSIESIPMGIDGAEIKIARDYEMLQGWGDYMHNCIASYFSSKVLLGGFFMGGELVANFELGAREASTQFLRRVDDINPYTGLQNPVVDVGAQIPFNRYNTIEGLVLKQLLGKYNNKLDDATKDHIMLLLKEHGVEISERVWA